ncbi:MAG: hypothetical protein GWN84_13730 [Gammaproteobacteria bacterium]|nr:hypothetical protein [Gammaproteobacteria bacterium]NIR83879.1 hypothetical protein [Gammaproteobacteria bacterium]NIU05189.1 hypothetical protein [Gammaproteobacteria bacterium]NIV52037.1 hypothetical protein [Gammaproteobacteria bacterium]NIX86462.1 hypothetical protein [Gammaproteobacteria bacterium]
MTAEEKLERADKGLAHLYRNLRRLAPTSLQSALDVFCSAVADRIQTVSRERDNLYALSAAKFDRSELDGVLQAARRK